MDDSVIAAIARWPNVPHVYGWLSLDRRGNWRLQGSPITNLHVTDFIGRNYERDQRGAWFFQNGPQRVYLQFEYTPWVLRIGDQQALVTHTGESVQEASEALLDENGNLLIAFERGIGLLEDRDLPAMLDAIVDENTNRANETALTNVMEGKKTLLRLDWWDFNIPLTPIRSADVATRFLFITDPQPADLG